MILPASCLFRLFQTFDNTTTGEVVWRKHYCHSVARNNAYCVQPQLIIEAGHYHVAVVKLNTPRTVGRRFDNFAFYPCFVLFCQGAILGAYA